MGTNIIEASKLVKSITVNRLGNRVYINAEFMPYGPEGFKTSVQIMTEDALSTQIVYASELRKMSDEAVFDYIRSVISIIEDAFTGTNKMGK